TIRAVVTGYRAKEILQLQVEAEKEVHNVYLSLWYMQAERGNKATDWTPAPEDALEYTRTQIRLLEDQISLDYVRNDELISGILIDEKGVRIDGDRLLINGDTEITGEISAPEAVFIDLTTERMTAIDAVMRDATIEGDLNARNAVIQEGTFRNITAINATIEDATITGEMIAGSIAGVDITGGRIVSSSSSISGRDIIMQNGKLTIET